MTVASAIGREFGLDQLAVLIDDLDEDALLEALDEALAAHLVEELRGTAGRYQFTHALIQATLADELSRTRRARLHARIAEALEALYGAQADAHAAELAHHFDEAQSVLGADRLVHYCMLAGESALSSRAPEQALVHFERALAAKGNAATDDQAAEVLFGLGLAQLATLGLGELGPAVTSLRRSFDHYVEAGDIRRAVAVAAHPLPLSLRFGYTDAAELITRALTLVSPGSDEEGRLLAQQGWFSGSSRRTTTGRNANSVGPCRSPSAKPTRPSSGGRSPMRPSSTRSTSAGGTASRGLRAIELAREAGDPSTEIPASRAAVFALTATGGREQVHSLMAPALAHAEQLRERWWLTSTSFSNEVMSLYEGDWRSAREMSDVGLAADPRDARHLALRAVLEYQLGDDDEGAAYIARLQEVAQGSRPPGPIADHVFLAVAIPLAGRVANDDERLDVARTAAAGVLSLPRLSPALALYTTAGLGLIAVQGDDAEAAGRFHGTLAAQRGTASFFVPLTTDRLLGLLAATSGRIDAALGHFAEGLAFCDRAGYRTEYAWTAADYADALLAHRRTDGRGKAVALQDEALAIARELGMRPLVERVLARRGRVEA